MKTRFPAAGALAFALTLGFSGAASALPVAQVDILGGSYCSVSCDETVVTDASAFTVYTYGNTATGNGTPVDPTMPWYLSVAITPQTTTGTDFGSFTVNGTTYTTADMTYGTPPLELFTELDGFDSGDLSTHGVYDTLFTQVVVNWDPLQTRSGVDVQSSAGTDPFANPGDDLYFVGFDVDASGLNGGFGLHFDLYSAEIAWCGNSLKQTFGGTLPDYCVDIDRDQFAPFSHDGASTPTEVPEPATLSLLGLGLLALGFARRRFRVS